nr:hypothetical protein [Tanacetum cinerariifolium]
MSYLSDFKEMNGGYVAFGGNPKGGKITCKGKIKIEKLDFDDVYFVKELKFNLFSVLQMCDKKNNVLFTDTKCLVLSFDFKLPDASQDETASVLKTFIVGLENLLSLKVKIIRCNNGTEFKNADLNQFYGLKGIKMEFSVHRPPQQNGIAERKNRTLIETMNYHPVLAENQTNSNVGFQDIEKAGEEGTQTYVLFIVLSDGSTNPKNNKDAHTDGKEHNDDIQKSMSPDIHSSSYGDQAREQGDKTMNKGKNPVVTITGFRDLNEEFAECIDNSSNGVNAVGSLVSAAELNFTNSTNDFSAADLSHSADDVGAEANINNMESIISVSSIPTSRIHKDHPTSQIISDLSSTTQTRSMAKGVRDQGGISQMFNEDFHTCMFACFLSQEEPKRVHQALKDPIARIEAIRLFLAYASFMGFLVYQMNVKSAFLYGTIEEEVYVCQPLGFEDPQHPDKVYKVVKALYGLHQAPRAWYETLATYLLENGFQRGTIDQTLFIKRKQKDILLVQIYVDDIIFGATNKALCQSFKKLMKDKFQMSSMGELTFFLGLQIYVDDIIFGATNKALCQSFEKLMKDKFQMSSIGELTFFLGLQVKQKKDGIFIKKPLLKDSNGKDVDVHTYRSMIGSLMYLTSSRPDIMFAGKPGLGLWYPKDSPFDLVAYSDSDYAGASLDRKSTTGGCQFLGCRLISWQCKKQTVVATSSTEAEYVAAASGCAQQFWNTAVVKRSGDVTRLQALVDKKRIVITEAVVHELLQLDDAEGVICLPNDEIFTGLARIGYEKPSTKLTFYKAFFSTQWKFLIHTILHSLSAKRTSWNEFSSAMASALICLSSGQRFNFSKYIFESLVRNVDSPSKFYMYPRFIQLIIQSNIDDLSKHTNIYISPILTQKVFANMRRVRKGFSGVDTPLFENMLVVRAVDAEEEVQVPAQDDDAQENVIEEVAAEVVPPIPTSPLPPSFVIPSTPPYQSPSPPPSKAAEGSSTMVQQVLEKCSALVLRVEGLENENVAQQLEIVKLKARVKKLEKLNKVKSSKLRRLKKVGTSQRIDSSEDEENVFNQGRISVDIDEGIELDVDQEKNAKIEGRQADTQAKIYNIDLDHSSKVLSMKEDTEVQEAVEVVTTAKLITEVVAAASTPIPAAKPVVKPKVLKFAAAAPAVSTRKRKGVVIRDPEEELHDDTPAETLSVKDKGKGILVKDPKPMKKKDQVEMDAEYANKLQEEELEKGHEEAYKNIDWNIAFDHVQAKDVQAKETQYIKRYHGFKKKPQSESEARKNMIAYLKNIEGFKMAYFKGKTYDQILLIFQARFDANMRFLFKSREEMEKEEEEIIKNINETPAQKAAKRRKQKEEAQRLSEEAQKKTDEAQEADDLRGHLEIVPNKDDDVFVEAVPLAQRDPIVDYQVVVMDNKLKYKIIRADDTHQSYISFITLLKNFDREDLETLWRIVKDRFSINKPTNFSDEYLLLTLKTMFGELDAQDAI